MSTVSNPSRRQGLYWMATMPSHEFTPYPVPGTSFLRGQLELGAGGFLHWQFIIAFEKKQSLASIRRILGPRGHYELTRSDAAREYVWKEDTRVSGTQFSFGQPRIRRNDAADWDAVWSHAVAGALDEIPADIRIRHYQSLRRISSDFAEPIAMERTCYVFWGRTGTGKSRRAWDESGMEAYAKDPRSKFWCGYRGQEHVVIDEFVGGIDISHILRWLDRYPFHVETKGGSLPNTTTKYWITSNIDPRAWYPEAKLEQVDALVRRLNITHFH